MTIWFLFLALEVTLSLGSSVDVNYNSGFEPRIIGGKTASKGRYPYFASLSDNSGMKLCGGSLIAPDVVLSAAHCIDAAAYAQVGRFNFDDSSDSFKEFWVVQKHVHPNYASGKHRFDVMLLKLNGTSSHSTVHVNPTPDVPSSGESVTAMGFGLTNANDASSRSAILLQVNLRVVNNTVCNKAKVKGYGTFRGEIKADMLCAQTNGRDTCLGDSGGPLVISGNSSAQDIQVGVTSWGVGCAMGFPGVYARLSYDIEWIKQSICLIASNPPSYFGCRRPLQSTLPSTTNLSRIHFVPTASPAHAASLAPTSTFNRGKVPTMTAAPSAQVQDLNSSRAKLPPRTSSATKQMQNVCVLWMVAIGTLLL